MVSIIILSYNTENLLKDCLRSLQKHLTSEYEIIVVDNASKDESVKMVERDFPQVALIKNTENAGFAKGCNLGAKHANGKYLLFLNSDITITEDLLPKFLATIEKNEKNACIGGLLQNSDGTLQRSYGEFYGLKNIFLMLFLGERYEVKRFKGAYLGQVDWVSGGCMFFRKDIFEEVGGFDEKFFMYIEDMELCFRVRKQGYTILVTPQIRVTHLGQGSSNKAFAIVNIYKGLLYFYKKHKSRVEYILVVSMLRIKAYLAIFVGQLKENSTVVSTYRKALEVL